MIPGPFIGSFRELSSKDELTGDDKIQASKEAPPIKIVHNNLFGQVV